MPDIDLPAIYRAYIACLNARDWTRLGEFVGDAVQHNGMRLGLPGYRAMLERDHREIPDLCFNIGLLICEPPHVACRLQFDCTPMGHFMGLAVNGRPVRFAENVFYTFAGRKIETVWSVIDKAAIEAELARDGAAPP